LPEGILKGLTKVQRLDLSNNQLQVLPEGIFKGLTNLVTLSLYNNQLQKLPANLNITLPKTERIYIRNAGKENKTIDIPIEQSERTSFKNKLYKTLNELAQEFEDYIFVNPDPEVIPEDEEDYPPSKKSSLTSWFSFWRQYLKF
ncbi:MAG: leucine-rich repeat domain-containing protein, partial [bacterium]